MKITVLGAGGAFSPMSRGNSAFMVEYKDRRILIDCGATVPYVLRDEMGVPLQSVTDIIVTHCHADHIGGMEALLYACKYMPDSKGKPRVYATRRVMNELVAALRPGMGWNINGAAYSVDEEFFVPVLDDGSIDDLNLEFCDVDHVGNMPAAAVLLGRLMVSGDTLEPLNPDVFLPEDQPSLIFHDAEFGYSDCHCPVGVLSGALTDEQRARTWLYHCPATAVAPEGFAGVLQKGQVFEL